MMKHAAILCLAATAAPAVADDHAPSSLRMREPRPAHTRRSPVQLGPRVAQLSPDAPPGDAPDPPPPPPPPTPAPTATPPPVLTPPAPAPSPPAKRTDDKHAAPAQEDGKTEVISVTDSSIEHKLFTGRAPVSVVSRADLTASGRATLGDILQALPVQANAGNAQVNAGGDGTTRINLRGLGAPRTLVLLNGRRIPNGGNGADASVDVNAIPLPVIERVEILKDGASALYGADAVGGVVNLITRPQYEGTDVSLLTSTSQRGDGTEYDAGFVTGFTTDDKNTYLVFSAGYQRHDPVFAGDRAFSAFQNSYDFASKTLTRNASLATPGGRLDVSSIGAGGVQPPGCTSGVCKPAADGTWTDFVGPRDLYNETASNYLYTPSTRENVFATAGNRIRDNVALFGELLYQHRDSSRQLSPVAFEADSPISKDSMYNPLGGDIVDYRRRITELGPRQYSDTISMLRLVVGLTGEAPSSWEALKGWKYEVSENYGYTSSLVGTDGQLNKPRVADALGPSMIDVYGNPICVRKPGDPTTQIVYIIPGRPVPLPCVPLNLLAPGGTIPRDQLKNLTFNDAGAGTDSQNTLLATANGRVATLPHHGEISLSLGSDYRSELGRQAPPSVASAGYTTDNTAMLTEGQFHLLEGFGELAIVPISGHDIAQRLEIDLGVRALQHDHAGSSVTYKAGGLFRTIHGIAMRGTYATAFRAPSVLDLYGGRTERTPYAEDPCDTRPPSVGDGTKALDPTVQAECTAQGVPAGSKFTTSQQVSVTGGNPDLTAETAATATLGVVIEPPEVKGLALTVDYWHVAINHAIETLGVQTIFANCYDRGVQAYCDQIRRDPSTHRISSVDQFLQNVTRTATSGIDLALWYDTRLATLGRIHTGLEGQYLLRYDLATPVQVIHGAGFYDLGAYPRYRANLSGSWIHPRGASGGFTLRFVGTYKECAGDDCNNDHNLAVASHDVDRYFKLDLFGSYDLRLGLGKTTVQVGVNNLFDATPPVVYNAAAANSDAATYDFIGRMIYVRLSQLF